MGKSKVSSDERRRVVQRLFSVQLGLIGATLALIFIFLWLESGGQSYGFFWFGFLAGCIGASLQFLKLTQRDANVRREAARSWIALLMPILYGGVMAGVTYLLFMSKILSGDSEGLLSTNLFPTFRSFADPADGAMPTIRTYLAMRPADIADVGKLMIWCFLAGYSERFVTGILAQLERRGADDKRDDKREDKRSDAPKGKAPA
jgi:hypothetical protein